MENWRSYVNTLDYVEPKVYLFEGKQKTTQKSLNLLFEESEKGLITEEEVLAAWRKSILYESQQLINEGVMDALSDGWKAIKKGGEWLTEKAMKAYAWAVKQWNKFWVNLWGGITVTLGKISDWANANMYIQSVLEDLGILRDKISDLKSEHPVLFKFAVVMLVCGACLTLMAFYSSEAHAVVKYGRKTVDEETINGMKGLLASACEADPSVCVETKSALRALNDYSTNLQTGGDFTYGPTGAIKATQGLQADEVLNIANGARKSATETEGILYNMKKLFGQLQGLEEEALSGGKKAWKAARATADASGHMDPKAADAADLGASLYKQVSGDIKKLIEAGEKSTYHTAEKIKFKLGGLDYSEVSVEGDVWSPEDLSSHIPTSKMASGAAQITPKGGGLPDAPGREMAGDLAKYFRKMRKAAKSYGRGGR